MMPSLLKILLKILMDTLQLVDRSLCHTLSRFTSKVFNYANIGFT